MVANVAKGQVNLNIGNYQFRDWLISYFCLPNIPAYFSSNISLAKVGFAFHTEYRVGNKKNEKIKT
jgi:hypothetical protein